MSGRHHGIQLPPTTVGPDGHLRDVHGAHTPFRSTWREAEPRTIEDENSRLGLKGSRRYGGDPVATVAEIAARRTGATYPLNRMLSYAFHPDERVARALFMSRLGVQAPRHGRDLTLAALMVRATTEARQRGEAWTPLLDLLASTNRWPARESVKHLYAQKEAATIPQAEYVTPQEWVSSTVAPRCESEPLSATLAVLMQYNTTTLPAYAIRHSRLVDGTAVRAISGDGAGPWSSTMAPVLAANPALHREGIEVLRATALARLTGHEADPESTLESEVAAAAVLVALGTHQPQVTRRIVSDLLSLAGAFEGPTGLARQQSLGVTPPGERRQVGSASGEVREWAEEALAPETSPAASPSLAIRKTVALRLLSMSPTMTDGERMALAHALAPLEEGLTRLVTSAEATPSLWSAALDVAGDSVGVRTALAMTPKAAQNDAIRARLVVGATGTMARHLLGSAQGPEVGRLFRRAASEDGAQALRMLRENWYDLQAKLTPADLMGLMRSRDQEVRTAAILASALLRDPAPEAGPPVPPRAPGR